MDTLRNLMNSGIVKPETLVTLHLPPLMAGVSGYQLSGHFYDDFILKYLNRGFRRMEYEADTDFCDVWLV